MQIDEDRAAIDGRLTFPALEEDAAAVENRVDASLGWRLIHAMAAWQQQRAASDSWQPPLRSDGDGRTHNRGTREGVKPTEVDESSSVDVCGDVKAWRPVLPRLRTAQAPCHVNEQTWSLCSRLHAVIGSIDSDQAGRRCLVSNLKQG